MVVIQHNDISSWVKSQLICSVSCSLPQQKEFSLPNRAFLVSTCLPLTSMYVENIKVYILFKREDPNALVNKTDTLWKHNKLSEHSHHPNYYSRINCYIYLTAYSRFITPYSMQTTPNHSADLIWSFLGTISLNCRQTLHTSNHACQWLWSLA